MYGAGAAGWHAADALAGDRLRLRPCPDADRPAVAPLGPARGSPGAACGLDTTFLVMAARAALGVGAALRLWQAGESDTLPHAHPDLPPDDPHLCAHGAAAHRHALVIDDLHAHWPDWHALVR